MKRFLLALTIAAVLGGCVILPGDYDDRYGDYHRHGWSEHRDGPQNWGGRR